MVGYNVDGKPVFRDELKVRVKDASKRVKSDNYIKQEYTFFIFEAGRHKNTKRIQRINIQLYI